MISYIRNKVGDELKLFISGLLFIALGYNMFQFVIFMKKRKEKVLIPATDEESLAIQKHPQSKNDRKESVKPYMLMLIAIAVLYILGFILNNKTVLHKCGFCFIV